jgi:hypothetical protein
MFDYSSSRSVSVSDVICTSLRLRVPAIDDGSNGLCTAFNNCWTSADIDANIAGVIPLAVTPRVGAAIIAVDGGGTDGVTIDVTAADDDTIGVEKDDEDDANEDIDDDDGVDGATVGRNDTVVDGVGTLPTISLTVAAVSVTVIAIGTSGVSSGAGAGATVHSVFSCIFSSNGSDIVLYISSINHRSR